jgi:alpha-tubulin suppressor-like RCC1 family protein
MGPALSRTRVATARGDVQNPRDIPSPRRRVNRMPGSFPASLLAASGRLAKLSLLGILAAGISFATSAAPAVSAGVRHVLAVGTDGRVLAWGDDSQGQLGLGRTLETNTPSAVPGVSGAVAVTAGANHVVALLGNGTLLAWGRNTLGELGDGSTTSRPFPAPVAALSDVIQVAAGEGHTLALRRDGTVWSWGVNYRGQLGYEGLFLSPRQVPGLPPIAHVAAGVGHSLAVTADGAVWAWGGGDYGQLGDGTRLEPYAGRSSPGPVRNLSGVVAIAAGADFSVAVTRDGAVWSWGRGEDGRLGVGSSADQALPVRLAGISDATAVSAGIDHALVLRREGTLAAWGGGYPGQLGDGRFAPSPVPVAVEALSGVTSASAGYFFSAARTADGGVWTWGYNSNGQLGNATTENRGAPVRLAGVSATAVAASGYHAFAVTEDGRILAWGANEFGELGTGGGVLRSTPALVPGASGVVSVAAGGTHSLALRGDGKVLAWGGNNTGQLGDGTYRSRSSAAEVVGLSGVRAIAAGHYHSMALLADGTVWMWGNGYEGELGNGGNESTAQPARVPGLSGIVAIATGPSQAFALAGDGTLWAWGENGFGQLGDGTTIPRLEPVRVTGATGLARVKAIAAGENHTLALTEEGGVWSWGINSGGELGDGTGTSRSVPGRVPSLSGIAAVSAGAAYSLALGRDGVVWSWGANWYGQLGDGSGDDQPVPVRLKGLEGIVQVSAGSASPVALRSDGATWSWGSNVDGRLGDGTFLDRANPVVVVAENGRGSLAGGDWFLDLDPAATGSIPAEKTPSFLAMASASHGDFSAAIRYREEDIGKIADTYVFALAPANLVKSAADGTPPLKLGKAKSRHDGKNTSVDCVLAQLTGAGVLQAVSPDQLSAALSGVLGALGQTVPVVTAGASLTVGGATFFVGYGSSGSAMLGSGLNRGVLTVPGARECRPQAPQTGWWWNPAEDGRGFSLEARGRNLFFAAFLYDVSGRASWYVSTGPVSLEGAYYAGDLLSASGGQTLGGPYPGFPALATVGRITLSFLNESTGVMAWPGGTVPIQRFNIVPSGLNLAPVAGQPESGWWWNEQEAGRGFFMEWQGGNLDIAGYMYDEQGNPVWYLTVGTIGGTAEQRSFSGNWWSYGNGQTLTGPWKPNARLSDNVAPVTLQFSAPDTALMTLPGGRTTLLKRHRF